MLEGLHREYGLTYLFISHSLPVVEQLASWIAVMRAGRLVECGPADRVQREPAEGYTVELLEAVPDIPVARKV